MGDQYPYNDFFLSQLALHKWHYVKNVYRVLLAEILTAIAVSSLMVFGNSYRTIVADLILAGYFQLMSKITNQYEYPHKFFSLGAETLIMSLLFGFVGVYVNNGMLLLGAWGITVAAVAFLTGYTFWATKRNNIFWATKINMDFQFVKPIIFSLVFPFAILYQVYYGFTPGYGVRLVFCGTGAVLLCGIIVVKTEEPIESVFFNSVFFNDDNYTETANVLMTKAMIESFFFNADNYTKAANILFLFVFGLFMFIMGMLI